MVSLSLIPLVSLVFCAFAAAKSCPALPNPLPSPTDLPVVDTFPDPFTFFNGAPLRSTADWECRKAELKTLVQEYFYGFYPDSKLEKVKTVRSGTNLTISVTSGGKTGSFNATLAFPTNTKASARHPVPVVINVGGVNTTTFLDSGIALATFTVTDVAADNIVPGGAFWDIYSGRDIGVITAWAWGFNRVLDAITQAVPEIDVSRVGVTGCSRDGKAALAAGIFDDRITLSMPMSSGLEGIAPWRFQFQEFGENEKIMNITGFAPYWSNTNLIEFRNNSHQIPFDAHLNVALIAPRAVIWDEGEVDYWTNPEGEARTTFVASHAVFDWLGVGNQVGVAIRNSSHCDIFGYTNVQAFMLNKFFGTPTDRDYADISPYTTFPSAYPWINDAPGKH